MRQRKKLIRGVVLMTMFGLLAGALGSTPGMALTSKDKKQVKKIARKQATKVFNSLSTGGQDGTGGLQQACADGSILAFANVQGAGGFSSNYIDVDGYNCTGGSVEAKRTALGTYRVRFGGLGVGATTTDLAVLGSAIGGSGGTIFGYGFASEAPEDVLVANTYDAGGNAVDKIFTISVLRP